MTMYKKGVIDHFQNPKNVGTLDEKAANVGTGLVGAPSCGDVMRLQIEVNEGVITKAVFKTFGCGSAIAASSLCVAKIEGKTLQEASVLTNTEIAEELELPPIKNHCSVLSAEAVMAAIEDYKNKQSA